MINLDKKDIANRLIFFGLCQLIDITPIKILCYSLLFEKLVDHVVIFSSHRCEWSKVSNRSSNTEKKKGKEKIKIVKPPFQG